MLNPFVPPVQSIIAREGWKSQIRENSARLAFAFGSAATSGWGELTLPDRIDFDTAFISEPHVAYGISLDGDKLVDTRFPRCTGGVYRWHINSRNLYVGAWVFCTVEDQSIYIPVEDPNHPNYDIVHHFTFIGVGIKDVPPELA